MKIKGLFMSAAVLAPMALAPIGVFAEEQPATDTSTVTANIESGGMSLVAADADFGDLVIGTAPKTAEVTDFLKVTDHTGGDGFSVNVKATNYNETKDTLLTTAHLENDVPLTDEAAEIQTGQSKLGEQKFTGSVTGEWGATPKAGAFSQDLVWTMTANIAPEEIESLELRQMMEELVISGNPGASNTTGADEQVVGDTMVMMNGMPKGAEHVGPNEYVTNSNVIITDTGMGSGKANSEALLFIGMNLDLTTSPSGLPANEVIESINAPDTVKTTLTETGIGLELERGALPLKFENEEKTKASLPFTFHLKDGTTATYTIQFNIEWQ